MKKEDFNLEVEIDENNSISISAWSIKNPKLMVEEHICELFPELVDEEIYDLGEGEMEYCGSLTKEELINRLKELNFSIK